MVCVIGGVLPVGRFGQSLSDVSVVLGLGVNFSDGCVGISLAQKQDMKKPG